MGKDEVLSGNNWGATSARPRCYDGPNRVAQHVARASVCMSAGKKTGERTKKKKIKREASGEGINRSEGEGGARGGGDEENVVGWLAGICCDEEGR